MLFEHLIRLSIAYIWDSAHIDEKAEKIEAKAQEYISAICGALSNPDNVLGDESGSGSGEPVLDPTIVCDHWTDAEIKEYLENYE